MFGSKMNLIWINLELFWILCLFLIYIYVYILHLGDEDYGWGFLSVGMNMHYAVITD